MIVSNADESNKDLIYASIKTFGDSLAINGRIAASHFCYLLAKCPFGIYSKKSSKLVLIGSSHNQDFSKFCQLSAIQATEIYEYAISLSSSSVSNTKFMDNFIKYKIIYASRLLEHGLINEAYKYIKVICHSININPSLHLDKISIAYELANRLKICGSDLNCDEFLNSTDQIWINEIEDNYKKFYLAKTVNLFHYNKISLCEQKNNIYNENGNFVSTTLETKFQNENDEIFKNQTEHFSHQDIAQHEHYNGIKKEVYNNISDPYFKNIDSHVLGNNSIEKSNTNLMNFYMNSKVDSKLQNTEFSENKYAEISSQSEGIGSSCQIPDSSNYTTQDHDIDLISESRSISVQNLNIPLNFKSINTQFQQEFPRSRNSSLSFGYNSISNFDYNSLNNRMINSSQKEDSNQLVNSQTEIFYQEVLNSNYTDNNGKLKLN
jgi:hypothetical protein